MKYKILVISHPCIVKERQKRIAELAKFDDLEVFLVTPKFYPEGRLIKGEKFPGDFKYYPLFTFFGKSGRQHIHFYPSLPWILKKINPTLIFLEEEPQSFITALTVFLNQLLGVNAKIVFFTSLNILRDYKRYSLLNIRRYIFPFFEKFVFRKADAALAVSRAAKRVLQTRGFDKRIKVLPIQRIDENKARRINIQEEKKKLCGQSFCIGFIGRFEKVKGIDILLKAIAKLKFDYKLLLIGGGSEKTKLKTLAKRLKTENNVSWIPFVAHEKIPEYINCFDVLVLPSRTLPEKKEKFGRVLIEAMACEVPVIGSSSGGIPGVIGDAGLIFKEENVDDLASKIELVYKDGKLRKDLAKRGRKRCIENYTYREFAKKFYKFIKEILSENKN